MAAEYRITNRLANFNLSALWSKLVILSLIVERLGDGSGLRSSHMQKAREIEIATCKP